MAGYVAFTGDFYLLSTFGLIHEGLEASKSSCWHFFISQLMFQKSETPELSKAWKLVKIQMCGLRISHFFPKSSQPIFIIKSQLPKHLTCSMWPLTHTSPVQPTHTYVHTHTHTPQQSPNHPHWHNSLSTFTWLLIKSHSSWHFHNLFFHFYHNAHHSKEKQVPFL